jgi:POT family proton-dependent oligopeptide transporter
MRQIPRGDILQQGKTNGDQATTIPISSIFRICMLIVPFCVAYSQMPTTFIVQGTVMRKAFGVIDAATMNTLDCLSVLGFGWLTGNYIYPALAKRGFKVPTTYKFAIGSVFGALAIVWALVVEHMIHQSYYNHQGAISILWQAPSYILIGWGEIFAVSAAYEAAFTASSPDKKALSSAINIFCVGGIPNVICIGLYQACHGWFQSSRGTGNIQHLSEYASAHVYKYFLVLLAILIFGVFVNTRSSVRAFVESVEYKAANIIRTPQPARPRPAGEKSPLLRSQDQYYIKKFNRNQLCRMGSMRAGSGLGKRDLEAGRFKIKSSIIPRMYRIKDTSRGLVASPVVPNSGPMGQQSSLPDSSA